MDSCVLEKINGNNNLYTLQHSSISKMDCKTQSEKWILVLHNKKYIVHNDVAKFIFKFQNKDINIKLLNDNEMLMVELLDSIGCFSKEQKNIKSKDYMRLIFKKVLFKENILKYLKIFSWMHSKACWLIFSTAIISNIFFVFWKINNTNINNYLKNSIFQTIIFWVLLYVCSIFHEIGHVSASIKYGIVPKSAGIGIYFVSPILFVDVDDTWKLKQYQRVIVDVAGLYFQLIFTLLFTLLYFLTQNNIFLSINKIVIVSTIYNLNPFLKFDGYWILSDCLGVYNLNQRMSKSIRFLFLKITKKESSNYECEDFDTKKNIIIGIYSLVSMLFFIYFGFMLLKSSIFNIIGIFSNFDIYTLLFSLLLLYFSITSIIALFKMCKDVLKIDNV